MLVAFGAVVLLAACGGSSEDESGDQGTSNQLLEIAKQAGGGLKLETEANWIHELITGSGYEVKSYEKFPGQPNGKKGRMLLYAAKNGKSGGAIYMLTSSGSVSPCWHWYFEDVAPKSAHAEELNDDGLWDLRIETSSEPLLYIQDETFTLQGKDRFDWIAQNGESSPPTSASNAMWYLFDGDTTTVWRSGGGSGKAFISIKAPFGVQDAQLHLRPIESDQPATCTLYADGKKVEEIKLEQKAVRQIVALPESVKGKRDIRLEFDGGTVSIAELAIK
jgi:hypothetical protein